MAKVWKQDRDDHTKTVKYTISPTYLSSLFMYMEKDLCRGDCILHGFCVIIPTLFPYFCRSGFPTSCYIFKCFLLLECNMRTVCPLLTSENMLYFLSGDVNPSMIFPTQLD